MFESRFAQHAASSPSRRATRFLYLIGLLIGAGLILMAAVGWPQPDRSSQLQAAAFERQSFSVASPLDDVKRKLPIDQRLRSFAADLKHKVKTLPRRLSEP